MFIDNFEKIIVIFFILTGLITIIDKSEFYKYNRNLNSNIILNILLILLIIGSIDIFLI